MDGTLILHTAIRTLWMYTHPTYGGFSVISNNINIRLGMFIPAGCPQNYDEGTLFTLLSLCHGIKPTNGTFSEQGTGIVNLFWYISAMHILTETNTYIFVTLSQIGLVVVINAVTPWISYNKWHMSSIWLDEVLIALLRTLGSFSMSTSYIFLWILFQYFRISLVVLDIFMPWLINIVWIYLILSKLFSSYRLVILVFKILPITKHGRVVRCVVMCWPSEETVHTK